MSAVCAACGAVRSNPDHPSCQTCGADVDVVVDAEIYTEVTVSLTDAQVAELRRQYSTWPEPDSTRTPTLAILRILANALPPEPIQLTIELPPGLARSDLFDHQIYSGRHGNSKGITMAEAEALTAVVSALRLREQGFTK